MPAADEPPLPRAAHRRQRLQLLPGDGAHPRRRPRRASSARLKPGDPVNVDTYTVGDEELAGAGVRRLPATLGEAVDAFEDDPLAKEVFGAELHADLRRVQAREWREYNTVVGEWEREQLPALW